MKLEKPTLKIQQAKMKELWNNLENETWEKLDLKPEFIKRMKKLEKSKFLSFKSLEELRKNIEE